MMALRIKSLFLSVLTLLSLLIPRIVLGDTTAINWGTQSNQLKLSTGKSLTVTCPANGQVSSRLWGTDIYTDDSSICTAAVHAGLIKAASGGTVQVEGIAGQSAYRGSQRNGVGSRDYGTWTGSFAVAKTTTGIVPPPPPPPSGQASLSVSPIQVAPGGKVTVQWSAPGRTGQTNWVGLYRAGTPADSRNLNRPIWTYVRQESGSHEFPLPIQAQPGQYVFQFFYGDGYDVRATSNTFTVGSSTHPPAPSVNKSLTGAWVHSADGTTKTPDSKVIVLHEGNQVTLVQSYKMAANRNEWQTLRCVGPLVGNQVRFQCAWAPGGDPMGYGSPWQATFNVSDDWDHLNGVGKEAHYYSRVP